MKTIAFKIQISDNYREMLIAELMDMDFDGFEEDEDILTAYIDLKSVSDVNREYLEMLLARYPGDNYIISEKVVEEKNWNETWEQSIQPVEAGPFWIQPTWWHKAPPADKIMLMIDPKMAFGTGYHETTRLMLKALPNVVSGGERVLDVGTGTGILAIAAVKLGAHFVKGLDVDEWSYQNATENLYLNGVQDQVEIMHGSLENLDDEEYFDVILANINRNTIRNLAPDLVQHLHSNIGRLVLSGLLVSDYKTVINFKAFEPLQRANKTTEGEWMALEYLSKP